MPVDALVEQALKALDRKDYAEAKRCLRQAVREAPLRSDVRELLVYTLEKSAEAGGDRPEATEKPVTDRPARRALGAASHRKSSFRVLVWTVVVFVILIGLVAAAMIALPRLQRSFAPPVEEVQLPSPEEIERRSQIRQAEILAEEGQYAAAVEKMRQVIEAGAPEPGPLRESMGEWIGRQAREAYDADDYGRALELLDQALKLRPNDADLLALRGQTLYFRGRTSRGEASRRDLAAAEEALRRAIEINPDLLRAYNVLALTLIAQDELLEGVGWYRKVIERAPESLEAREARRQLTSRGMQP